jgi:hypothetical protein
MKPGRIPACLMLALAAAFSGGTLLAYNPSKIMGKVQYQQYTGRQIDWPRSAEPIPLVKTRHGMPIYDKLPNRPYRVLGVMSDEGEHSIRHVAEAARVAEADALLIVGDKAFTDAGITISPELLENATVPDPNGPTEVRRLDHPEALKLDSETGTIRVTRIRAILIRWITN